MWSKQQQNIQKVQLLQNFASGILTGKIKYLFSTTVGGLRWLSIRVMLQLRDVTVAFKIQPAIAASYLESMPAVKRFYIHSHNTRQKDHLLRYYM